MAVNSKNIRARLSALEQRLQRLIEQPVKTLFHSQDLSDIFIHKLIIAMKNNVHQDESGKDIAPTLYRLSLPPEVARTLTHHEDVLDKVAFELRKAGAVAGITFPTQPVIQVIEDPALPQGQMEIIPSHSSGHNIQTSDMAVSAESANETLPTNAFLIVDGTHYQPINRPVINLGRRPDNDIVVSDPRVSRLHAQIRAIEGRFVIFDLASTWGTFVNGQAIHEHILLPGDTISLGGVPLVFGQDNNTLDETQGLTPPSVD